MGIILEAVRRAHANYKLSRGRCANCGLVLRDDETSPFCSDECNRERQDLLA